MKPRPGPHKGKASLPLLILLRDLLGVAKTRREVSSILARRSVMIDGVVRKEDDFPVGLMDIIEIPELKKTYRVLASPGKGLILHGIKLDEKDFKLCKIIGKTTIKGSHIQLNLHDGRNFLVKLVDPKHPVEDVYKTNDSLKVKVPNLEILGHIKFEPGSLVLVERGRNAGRWGEVLRVSKSSIYGSTTVLMDAEGKEIETTSDYVFPIGKGETWISLPEETKA